MEELILNEYVKKEKYSYQIWWPYSESLNPEKDEIDVYVRFNESDYIGTFTTPEKLMELLSDTLYIFLKEENSLLVRKISHQNIEEVIDNLIEQNNFFNCFIKENK